MPRADGNLVYTFLKERTDRGHIDTFDGASGQKRWDRRTNRLGRRRSQGKLRSPWRFASFERSAASSGRVYVIARGEEKSPSFLYAFRAGKSLETH